MYSAKTSIYVHFPFCAQRCPYCDFNVHVKKQIPQKKFIESILLEAQARSASEIWKDRKISTVFFGGGTPSLFKADLLAELITGLQNLWRFEDQPEISMEANPEEIDQAYCTELLKAGINRLSIGVQSFQEDFLKKLGRIHSAEKAKLAVSAARQAGFKNISIDLMFGLPGQGLAELDNDLKQALQVSTDHISYYNLTIERGTNFYQRQIEGKLQIADDDQSAQMMQLIISKLEAAGYGHYEISNYARDGKQCRHNLGYWRLNDYLGLGPGAHSAHHLKSKQLIVHSANISDPESYMKSPANSLAWTDNVQGMNYFFEKIMLGLRLQSYFDLTPVLNELPESTKQSFMQIIRNFEEEKFITVSGLQMRTTSKGMLILDSLLAEISECLK